MAIWQTGRIASVDISAKPDARRTEGREILLDAAIRCIVERGYFGTSIRDIAEAAGMTSAALYHHFGSKQAILCEIMKRALDEAYAMTTEAAHRGTTTPDKLRLMVDAWVRFHCIRRNYALIGASEIRSLDDDGRRWTVQLRDRQELAFRELIEDGTQAGVFEVDDVALATRAIITMGTAVSTWFDPDGPQQPEVISAQIADLALKLVT